MLRPFSLPLVCSDTGVRFRAIAAMLNQQHRARLRIAAAIDRKDDAIFHVRLLPQRLLEIAGIHANPAGVGITFFLSPAKSSFFFGVEFADIASR